MKTTLTLHSGQSFWPSLLSAGVIGVSHSIVAVENTVIQAFYVHYHLNQSIYDH